MTSLPEFIATGKSCFTSVDKVFAVLIRTGKTENSKSDMVTYLNADGSFDVMFLNTEDDFRRLVIPFLKRMEQFAHFREFKCIEIGTNRGLQTFPEPHDCLVNWRQFSTIYTCNDGKRLSFSTGCNPPAVHLTYAPNYQGSEQSAYLATLQKVTS